jgi:Tfp pilus assembly protein FimT
MNAKRIGSDMLRFCRKSAYHRSDKGFSLFEILIVVAIVMLFSIIAIPGFMRTFSYANVNGMSDQLAGDIRYAQQLAITTVNPYFIQLYYAGTSPASPDVANSYKMYSYDTSGTLVVLKRVNLDQNAYVVQSDFSNGLLRLETNGTTTPLNDGRIFIGQTNSNVTTDTNSHFCAVTVKYSTGKVKIYRDVWPSTW